MRRAVLALCGSAAVGVLVLTGCTSAASERPDYRPSPTAPDVEGPGVRVSPVLPVPSLEGPGGGGSQGSSPGAPSSSGPAQDPQVVATKLTAPVGLTMLPDNTALVGERTTGRIVRVQPRPGQPVPTVRTLAGVDGAGDGGLLDLALSPTYDEDSLIYAYLTTRTDNRVVAFTLNGPVTPVLTGIPRGRTGNTGRLRFTASGTLFVGTGDAGNPSLATNPRSLAGKVLRVNDIGAPAAGNPVPSSPVYASGLRQSAGLCPLPSTSTLLQVEPAATGRSEVNSIVAGGDYTRTAPLGAVPAASGAAGGCAVQDSSLFVGSLDGKELLSAPLTGAGAKLVIGPFRELLKSTYGRLRTVVAASDGALWLTTSNRDGKGKPVAADERVIRYLPQRGGGTDPA
jgi:glucose/arabinose dehydrogenase